MNLKSKITNSYYAVLILLLLLSIAYVFMSLPLQVGDTDIWYHLSGGRYFSTHGSPAYNSYFSFIQPERLRSNYYWLFQVIVYKIYSFTGERGLIAFRTLSFMVMLLLILFFLYKRQKENINYITFIIIVYAVVLMPRYSVLRPHVFSYALIAAFICILEFYPKKTIVLPALALLWVNVHGIEFPVMLLILISYYVEPILLRIRTALRKSEKTESSAIFTLPLVVAMAMIYVTPNGLGLLEVPFISTDFASQYIAELRQPSIKGLFSLSLSPLNPNLTMFSSIILIMAFLSFLKGLLQRSIKIHHAILFIGGTFLLLKGVRFTNEFVLLALPVIASVNIFGSSKSDEIKGKISYLMVNTAFLLMTFFMSNNVLSELKRGLTPIPRGVTQFLAGLDAGGNLLTVPNCGGYTQWMLYPKYKIFMDMEVPHLFTDIDMYVSVNVFLEDIVLKRTLEKYDPAFLSVPIGYRGFTKLIKKYPNYKAIFFDDIEVLYVNNRSYPKIADQYELKEIDPFALGVELMEQVKFDKNDNYTAELNRIFDIYPNMLVTQALVQIYNLKGQYERALPYTDITIRNYPEVPGAYTIKAEILSGLRKYGEAAKILEAALGRANDIEKKGIYHQLYICYFNLGDNKKAYDALKKSVDVYSPKSSYEDIYNLAALSIMYGKPSDPVTLFNIALLKLPPERDDLKIKIETALNAIKK
ncbi:MAG: tetratricopeptide repeat protein [Nitrospirota bacterium]